MINFLFLGTSSGVPTAYRNVSGLAIRLHQSKEWMLIDAGEGTQHTIAKAKLSLLQLKMIAITHSHGDHCFGLPGILASASLAQRKTPLSIICTEQVWQWLQHTIELTAVHLSYTLEWIDVTQKNTLFEFYKKSDVDTKSDNALQASLAFNPKHSQAKQLATSGSQLHISGCALVHRVASYAFVFEFQKTSRKMMNLEALKALAVPRHFWQLLQQGKDIEWNGKTLLATDWTQLQTTALKWIVGGDNAEPIVLEQACKNANLLIHEATYSQAILDKVGPGPMHSSAKILAQFAQQAKLPNLVLTHLSSRYHHPKGEAEILNEAQDFYKGNSFIAQDGQIYTLSENGQFQLSLNFLNQ